MNQMDTNTLLRSVRSAARNKYAWPGGYPIFILMEDGGTLCPDCAKNNYRQISQATRMGGYYGWSAAGVDVNCEDKDMVCCHCNEPIQCAYPKEET